MTARARARVILALLTAAGLAALAWAAFVSSGAQVVYNPTDSVPPGWYRIVPVDASPRPLSVGAVVLTPLPPDAAQLAAQRGYLPINVPLLKRVGAVAPQHVCTRGGVVRVDGTLVAVVRRIDRRGRPLPAWRQCRALRAGEVFLLGTHSASFDSRYFGPVRASAVFGVAHPLWLDAP